MEWIQPSCRHSLDKLDDSFYVTFAEHKYDEHLLNVHLDNRLSDQRRAEERPKRNQKVSARDAGEIKQRIRNLEKTTTTITTNNNSSNNNNYKKLILSQLHCRRVSSLVV